VCAQDLVHARSIVLECGANHESAFGVRQKGIDLICQPEEIFCFQIELLDFGKIHKLGKIGLKCRIGHQRREVFLDVGDVQSLAEFDEDLFLLSLDSVDGCYVVLDSMVLARAAASLNGFVGQSIAPNPNSSLRLSSAFRYKT
jgi:hypothetical protein